MNLIYLITFRPDHVLENTIDFNHFNDEKNFSLGFEANLYRTLADQVREHDYDIKDINRDLNN